MRRISSLLPALLAAAPGSMPRLPFRHCAEQASAEQASAEQAAEADGRRILDDMPEIPIVNSYPRPPTLAPFPRDGRSADWGFPKAVRVVNRELIEEARRPERPPDATLPRGWTMDHRVGEGYFTLQRRFENELGTVELMRIAVMLEVKEPEGTYKFDTGERAEPEHFNFTLFISKPESTRAQVGGLEFQLTSIEGELVFDGLTVHSTPEELATAWEKSPSAIRRRNERYRGPYVNELDEDFADEIMDYLDERGMHNAFAEYVQMQAHVLEQENYEHWLRLVRAFSGRKRDAPGLRAFVPKEGDAKGDAKGDAEGDAKEAGAETPTSERDAKNDVNNEGK